MFLLAISLEDTLMWRSKESDLLLSHIIGLGSAVVGECLCCDPLGYDSLNKSKKEVLSKGKTVTFSLHNTRLLGPSKKGPTSYFPLLFVRAPKTGFLSILRPSYNITIQVPNKGCFLLHLLLNIPVGLDWTLSPFSVSWIQVTIFSVACLFNLTTFSLHSILKKESTCWYNCIVSWFRGLQILTTLHFVITCIFVDTWTCRHNITCSTSRNIAEVCYELNHARKLTGAGRWSCPCA